jgi:hypothetical protein
VALEPIDGLLAAAGAGAGGFGKVHQPLLQRLAAMRGELRHLGFDGAGERDGVFVDDVGRFAIAEHGVDRLKRAADLRQRFQRLIAGVEPFNGAPPIGGAVSAERAID